MIKIIAKVIHWLNPDFFKERSFNYLFTWGIEDVFEGVLIFIQKTKN